MSIALAEINNEHFSKNQNQYQDESQLKIEIERLKTTVYLLNQKLKL